MLKQVGTPPTLFAPQDFNQTWARGINDAGVVVGDSVLKGFLRSPDGTFSTIVFPGADVAHPWGINNKGEIVGSYTESKPLPGAPGVHGFFRSSDGFSITEVHVPGSFGTLANGINDLGEIVGTYYVNGEPFGFLRSPDGQYTKIEISGFRNAMVNGLNNHGDVVGSVPGGFGVVRHKNASYDVLWVPGAKGTYATGINDLGQVVGYYSDSNDRVHGFLATAGPARPLLYPFFYGVTSATSFDGPSLSVAPGSWMELYGWNLSKTSRSWSASDFRGSVAPTMLDGVSVQVNGVPAVVSYVSSRQINAQVPAVASGNAQVVVTVEGSRSEPYTIRVDDELPRLLAPESFRLSESGSRKFVVALLSDGHTFVLPPFGHSITPSRPAKPGEVITLYGIGFGPVVTSSGGTIPPGQVATEPNRILGTLQFTIDGKPASVTYAGLAPGSVGLYQFNIMVPDVRNLFASLEFTLNGVPRGTDLYTAIAP